MLTPVEKDVGEEPNTEPSSKLQKLEQEEAERAARNELLGLYKNHRAATAEANFQGMILKRIVKENHGQAISHLCFNFMNDQCHNVLATVGGPQANLYNNESRCNQFEGADLESPHLDLMLQWPGVDGVALRACTFVADAMGDSVLAVGGSDGRVRVLSTMRKAEVAVIDAHQGPVTHLAACQARPGMVASVSTRDDAVHVWCVCGYGNAACLATYGVSRPTVAAISPNGDCLLVGTQSGAIHQYALPAREMGHSHKTSRGSGTPVKVKHDTAIDSLRFIDGGTVISKSKDAKTVRWSLETDEYQVVIKPRKQSSSDWCPLDISSDGRFMCVGNSSGEVLVYDAVSGNLVARLKHPRVKQMQITACAFTHDASEVACVTEKSFIFRYDYVAPQLLAEWDKADRDSEASDNDENEE